MSGWCINSLSLSLSSLQTLSSTTRNSSGCWQTLKDQIYCMTCRFSFPRLLLYSRCSHGLSTARSQTRISYCLTHPQRLSPAWTFSTRAWCIHFSDCMHLHPANWILPWGRLANKRWSDRMTWIGSGERADQRSRSRPESILQRFRPSWTVKSTHPPVFLSGIIVHQLFQLFYHQVEQAPGHVEICNKLRYPMCINPGQVLWRRLASLWTWYVWSMFSFT